MSTNFYMRKSVKPAMTFTRRVTMRQLSVLLCFWISASFFIYNDVQTMSESRGKAVTVIFTHASL